MCGIAGVIHRGQLQGPENLSAHFIKGLIHRGPDHQGVIKGDQFLFIHTRLSIIDLNPQSNQPFESNDDNYIVVFNGEIYNYQEVRNLLKDIGYSFRTNSDTEVLLQGFIAWKEKVLDYLDGMFAFAIYDKKNKKLFAARDRVGKKPLFYLLTPHLFAFASEADVLAQSGLIKKQLSLRAINSFLAIGYILSPYCLYENIYQLDAGSFLWLNVEDFTIQKKQYWNILNFYERKIRITKKEAVENIKHLLREAVRKRLIADVEVGVFLSGGIDSSIVALLAGEKQQQLKTFTAGFNNRVFDETQFAKIVSKQIVAQQLTCTINKADAPYLQNVLRHMDSVLADTSVLAMYPLAKYTSGYVKTVLSGDGADELFGGYDTYKAHSIKKALDFLPAIAWKTLHSTGKYLPAPKNAKISLAYKWDKFFASGGMDYIEAHYHFREHHSVEERIAIMGREHADMIRDTNPLIQFRKYYDEAKPLDDFEKLLYVDFKTWLPDDILVKVDRTCMASGLEVRSPFLDKDLVEFVASLPSQFKTKGFYNKQILRDAFDRIIPQEILQRKKSGFNVPLDLGAPANQNEYKAFNNYIYKHKIDGQYNHSGI